MSRTNVMCKRKCATIYAELGAVPVTFLVGQESTERQTLVMRKERRTNTKNGVAAAASMIMFFECLLFFGQSVVYSYITIAVSHRKRTQAFPTMASN